METKTEQHGQIWSTDVFYGTLRKTSSDTLILTMPKKLAEFGQYKEGDVLKVLVRKKDVSQ